MPEPAVCFSDGLCHVTALVRFRGTEDVGAEMEDIRAEYTALKNEPKVSIVDLWTDKFLRSVTFIAAMLMVCQQFSGINAVRKYVWR